MLRMVLNMSVKFFFGVRETNRWWKHVKNIWKSCDIDGLFLQWRQQELPALIPLGKEGK